MISFAKQFAASLGQSQNGEDGIIRECLTRMPLREVCAEFGAHDGRSYSNTAWLIRVQGWFGAMIEADASLFQQCALYWRDLNLRRVRCVMARVTPENVNDLIPEDASILSIDMDGGELEVFMALKIKPAIVIIEIDSSLNPKDPTARNSAGGVGYRPMVRFAIERGYFLLAHVGNCIFVDAQYKSLFPEITADPLTESDLYFNRSWRGPEPT